MLKGIDISDNQGTIDWDLAKLEEYDFVIIRIGTGRWETGGKIDNHLDRNIKEAKRVGIKRIGVYFYSYALTMEHIEKELEFSLSILRKYKKYINWPVAFDIEDKTQRKLGKERITMLCAYFLDNIADAGYQTLLYSYKSFIIKNIDFSMLKHDIWLSHFATKTDFSGHTIWQYSSKHKVGWTTENDGNVDVNYAYKDYLKKERLTMVLKKGSRGQEVIELQENFNLLGYSCGKTDGIFGTSTHKALVKFQKEHSLWADGIYGSKTQAEMQKAIEVAQTPQETLNECVDKPKAFRTLKYKSWSTMKGDDVKWVQEQLIRYGLGGLVGKVDGVYGKSCKNAINEFQRGLGLYPDGIAGAITQQKLSEEEYWLDKFAPLNLFKCKCGGRYCNGHMTDVSWSIRVQVIRLLEIAKVDLDKVTITSGNRCSIWNKKCGGATYSQHQYWRAVDIKIAGLSVQQVNAIALEINPYGGVGLNGNTITHIDTRGRKSRWYYNQRITRGEE